MTTRGEKRNNAEKKNKTFFSKGVLSEEKRYEAKLGVLTPLVKVS